MTNLTQCGKDDPIVVVVVVVIQALYGSIAKRQKYKGNIYSMNYKERGSHARGVYPTRCPNSGSGKCKNMLNASSMGK